MSKSTNKKQALALSRNQIKLKWRNEILFKKMLERNDIDFTFQKPFWSRDWFYVGDFFIEEGKILIELDSSYHSKKHDKIRTKRLKQFGLVSKVIRIKNTELQNNPSNVYNIVLDIKKGKL